MNYIIRRKAPSIKNLIARLGVDRNTAIYMRQTIHTASTVQLALQAIAEHPGFWNHGVEYLLVNPYDYPVSVICRYINMGDTYKSTLIAQNNRIFISCWGDVLETYERKHGPVA